MQVHAPTAVGMIYISDLIKHESFILAALNYQFEPYFYCLCGKLFA